jgi:DNA-binding transcriptional LysR family regulator
MTDDAGHADRLVALRASAGAHLPELGSFLAVATAGSFRAAADASGLDRSVLSRRVRRLEAWLGVRLLDRSTRVTRLTDEGRLLLERSAADYERLVQTLAEAQHTPGGVQRVRVSTMGALASLWVGALARIRETHPDLCVNFTTSDAHVGLSHEAFDIAVRAGNPPDSGLVGRRIASWHYLLCASPEWVARVQPAQPEDLVRHWLLYHPVPRARRWTFARRDGRASRTLEMDPSWESDNVGMIVEALRAGHGVSALPPFPAERHLADGSLVRVLPDWELDHPQGVWLLLPHRRFVPSRVQTVADTIADVVSEAAVQWAALHDA